MPTLRSGTEYASAVVCSSQYRLEYGLLQAVSVNQAPSEQRDDIAVHMAAERVTQIFKIPTPACRSMHTRLPLYEYGCPVQTGPRAGARMSVGRGVR